MNTFSRYLFRQVAGALLLILLSLAGIVWIALALARARARHNRRAERLGVRHHDDPSSA